MNDDHGHRFTVVDDLSVFHCGTQKEGIWSEWLVCLDCKRHEFILQGTLA